MSVSVLSWYEWKKKLRRTRVTSTQAKRMNQSCWIVFTYGSEWVLLCMSFSRSEKPKCTMSNVQNRWKIFECAKLKIDSNQLWQNWRYVYNSIVFVVRKWQDELSWRASSMNWGKQHFFQCEFMQMWERMKIEMFKGRSEALTGFVWIQNEIRTPN